MVAVTILLVGLLGTAAIIDHATSVAGTNNGRVAATNLAREILEDARSIDYERLNPTQIAAALQAPAGPRRLRQSLDAHAAWRRLLGAA